MTSGIYCIENLVNGKKYIGKGINVKNRMKRHHKESTALFRAIKKYGKENFKRYIILYCEIEELTYYETGCIKIYHSHVSEGRGYNISWGGDSPMLGRNHSEESIEKIKKNHADVSGENHPMFGKRGEDSPLFGKPRSDETKKKISLTLIGKKRSNASSKYFGISKLEKGWRIDAGKYVGCSKDEIEAAKTYDKYVIENNLPHPLNFPKDYPNREFNII